MLARTRATVTMLAILAAALPAHAQPAAAPAAAPAIKLGGYLETYFQWNLRDPSNSVTALRAYDDRHDSLEIENAVIEATWTKGSLSGRVALQAGDTGSLYYSAADAAFRNLQEAWV